MRQIVLLCLLLSTVFLCAVDDRIPSVGFHMRGITIPSENLVLPSPSRTVFDFITPPTPIFTSFWDYQIGGYTSMATRVQSPTAGNGVYLAYTGQREPSPAGIRRVFYAYVNPDGSVDINNEISTDATREGYVSLDVDRVSGKPIFAWHADMDPTASEYEVSTTWDVFLEGIPGLINPPSITIHNPTTLTIGGAPYDDNEFIWPVVQIGPSPVPNMRRAYVFATNAVTHCNPGNPSENPYFAYADFNGDILETVTTLTWNYASVPLLNDWNVDQTAWRRFFHSDIVGEDGKIYMIGFHTGTMSNGLSLSEPYLDVLVNTNYGEGEWTKYSINPDLTYPNPKDFFTDDTDNPFALLRYSVLEGSHNSGYIAANGNLHFPLTFGYTSPDSTQYIPLLQYMKDVEFNVTDNTFLIHDLYPTGLHPNDGVPVVPWDMDEDGIIDTLSNGDVTFTPSWPYVYWDETADGGSMLFDYNSVKYTKANEQGMVACVWSSSLRAKLYNETPADYPELAPFSVAPEIFISVYPVTGTDGPQWSVPISLNSVEVAQMHLGANPIIPEWAYPGDYIEYLGDNPQGDKIGKLHLMFFDDNTWGAGCLETAVGQNNGGRVMYASVKIAWSPGNPIPGVNDPIVSYPPELMQNYPNPFNPTTTIAYNISKPGHVSLTIYNVKGQKVRNLVSEMKQIGSFTAAWNGLSDDGTKVGSGVYFYRLENNGQSTTKKMIMLK